MKHVDPTERHSTSIHSLAEDGLRTRLRELEKIIKKVFLTEDQIIEMSILIESAHDIADGWEPVGHEINKEL